MNCIILNYEKVVIMQIQHTNDSHLSGIKNNVPEACYFLFLPENRPVEGAFVCVEDLDFTILKGKYQRVKKTKIIRSRVFYWEKYLDTINNYPSEDLYDAICENQLHIYSGGSEETVPHPMPEDEYREEEVDEFISEGSYTPVAVYDKDLKRL